MGNWKVAERRQRVAMGANPWTTMPNNPISHEVATDNSGHRMRSTAVATSWLCQAEADWLLRAYARSYLLSSLGDYLNPEFWRSAIEAVVFLCAPRYWDFQLFRDQ